jgi:DNA polymerase family A
MLPLFAADTETSLIFPACQAPPLVCLQFAVDDAEPSIIHARDPACRRTIIWALEHTRWSFHNLAFDCSVICAAYPDLTPLVFEAFEANRMHCTIARQKLIDIASGRFKQISHSTTGYALDGVARRLRIDLPLDKEDPWRLRYGTLWGVVLRDWPKEAIDYALLDVTAQRLVHRAQDEYQERLTDEFRQARKSFWTALMACRGIVVDPQRVDQYIRDVRESLEEDRQICEASGLVVWERVKWTKKTLPAQEHMVRICRETEEDDLPITETGEKVLRAELGLTDRQYIPRGATWGLWQRHGKYVRLDEDACQQYGDELLEAYQRFGTSTTQIARAERLRAAAVRRVPIQSRFQSLGADTGRMTCSQGDSKAGKPPSALGFQLQNPAKDKKVKRLDGTITIRKGTRELFVPRPGFYFCSVDYAAMELCGWAQICLWTVGFSKLAEVLNEGRDPHTEFGARLAGITAAEAYARVKGLRGSELEQEFTGRYRQLAKISNFGYMGGLGPAKMVLMARKQYGVPLTLEEAKALREAWMQMWPEARAYFAWANRQLKVRGVGEESDRRVAVTQFRSGRIRGGMYYTQLCNGMFQGFCADIFGEAAWHITREMYVDTNSPLFGSRMVNALHDETLSELRIEHAHEAAHRQATIQIETARKWGPDVRWAAEPALMTRWSKDAKPSYVAGKLVPWLPLVA